MSRSREIKLDQCGTTCGLHKLLAGAYPTCAWDDRVIRVGAADGDGFPAWCPLRRGHISFTGNFPGKGKAPGKAQGKGKGGTRGK